MLKNRFIKLLAGALVVAGITLAVRESLVKAGIDSGMDNAFRTPPMSDYKPVDNSFHTPPMSDYRPVDNSFHTPPISDYKP